MSRGRGGVCQSDQFSCIAHAEHQQREDIKLNSAILVHLQALLGAAMIYRCAYIRNMVRAIEKNGNKSCQKHH